MRIISGKYGGRKINAPSSKFTRPTTNMVKGSIFDMLQNRLNLEGATVLDIYAGSGSLGIEALSRGAEEVHFVEQNYSVFKVLLSNIKSIEAEESCKVFKRSVLQFTKSESNIKYDLILADPPFFKDDIHDVFNQIIENNFLNKDGIFIIERSIQTEEKDLKKFGIEPKKKIGDSLIYWYEN